MTPLDGIDGLLARKSTKKLEVGWDVTTHQRFLTAVSDDDDIHIVLLELTGYGDERLDILEKADDAVKTIGEALALLAARCQEVARNPVVDALHIGLRRVLAHDALLTLGGDHHGCRVLVSASARCATMCSSPKVPPATVSSAAE